MSQVPTILRQAGDLIRKHGWTQDDYGDTTQGFCAVGAIIEAAIATDTLSVDSTDALETYLRTIGAVPDDSHGPFANIPDWNDMPDQSAEAVITTLYGAADYDEARRANS